MPHSNPLRSTLLDGAGICHEFGQREATPVPPDLVTVRQVHGVTAIWPVEPGAQAVEADAVLARAGHCVGVVTADCVPLLFASPRARIGAAVHAGWRGTFAGMAAVAVRELVAAGADAADLLVAVGPAIGPCCYEVSADLAEQFGARFGPSVVVRESAKTSLDLAQANLLELLRLGVSASHIELLRLCTRCQTNTEGAPRFHSFRREGKAAGRQISYVRPQ